MPSRPSCPAPTAPGYYLPDAALTPRGEYLHWVLTPRYEQLLQAMGEPSLYCGVQPGDSYRLAPILWFGVPAAVRLTHTRDGVAVSITKLEAPAAYIPPGKVIESMRRVLPEAAWTTVEQAADRAAFWRVPTITGDADAVAGGRRTWILEGRRGSVYHVVSRNLDEGISPGSGDLGLAILELTGVKESSLESGAPGVKPRPYFPQPDVPPPPPSPRGASRTPTK